MKTIFLVLMVLGIGCTKKKEAPVAASPTPALRAQINAQFFENAKTEDAVFKFYQILSTENANILISPDVLKYGFGSAPADWKKESSSASGLRLEEKNVVKKGKNSLFQVNVSFEAKWLHPFTKELTSPDFFKSSRSDTMQIKFMHQIQVFPYANTADAEWIELPYLNTDLVLDLALPKKQFELSALEAKLSADYLEAAFKSLSPEKIALKLPQAAISVSVPIHKKLTETGNGSQFKLTAKNSGGDSELIQNAELKLDQEGTAPTQKEEKPKGGMQLTSPTKFYLDQPFFFVLRNVKTKKIIFLGRFTRPNHD